MLFCKTTTLITDVPSDDTNQGSIETITLSIKITAAYRFTWDKTCQSKHNVTYVIILYYIRRALCNIVILRMSHCCVGPGISVGIATGYGLDGPGIESQWGKDFPHLSRLAPGAHPASCTMGTGSFPGVESGQGMTLITHPLLVPRSKSRVELYLYSP
jgi:hypothetical protein